MVASGRGELPAAGVRLLVGSGQMKIGSERDDVELQSRQMESYSVEGRLAVQDRITSQTKRQERCLAESERESP
ncbi:hypothetical protein E2C01_099377 [Portunus trituberculatus]|uniref:Uncharacterized protein n=1 Tax=Portunus trituberculatus TaxID=210409 RepID=A0A5B7KAU1_PORTR|nr:hypothetical protein [Portunus trituberculatus]